MAGFDPAKIRAVFGLSEEDQPLVVVAIGKLSQDESNVPEYAKGAEQKPRERKTAAEIVKRL
jgi:hypothetical protein